MEQSLKISINRYYIARYELQFNLLVTCWQLAEGLKIYMNMLFGNKIKELRDENGILQRQLAALLEIDTPMFSKIERGDRRAKREQVIKLAEYFHQDEKEMLTLWLADKFIDAVEDEQDRDLCNDAIIIAQEKIKSM